MDREGPMPAMVPDAIVNDATACTLVTEAVGHSGPYRRGCRG
jgi:hypothetical protein